MLKLLINRYPRVTADWELQVTSQNDSELSIEHNMPKTQILRTVVSSTFVLPSEQSQEYMELGKALGEMVELADDDEWRIDKPVYATACYIAAELKFASIPAPRIFNHGPKSVVFNWTAEYNNVYFTISSDRISALASSPKRIEKRIDRSLKQITNPALLLSSFHPIANDLNKWT